MEGRLLAYRLSEKADATLISMPRTRATPAPRSRDRHREAITRTVASPPRTQEGQWAPGPLRTRKFWLIRNMKRFTKTGAPTNQTAASGHQGLRPRGASRRQVNHASPPSAAI